MWFSKKKTKAYFIAKAGIANIGISIGEKIRKKPEDADADDERRKVEEKRREVSDFYSEQFTEKIDKIEGSDNPYMKKFLPCLCRLSRLLFFFCLKYFLKFDPE